MPNTLARQPEGATGCGGAPVIPLLSLMLPDIDIWRAANQWIKQHGTDAAAQAVTMADKLAAEGDEEGQRTWLGIITAIEWLQDNRGRDPFKVEH